MKRWVSSLLFVALIGVAHAGLLTVDRGGRGSASGVLTPQQDWDQRSTTSGVFFRHDFTWQDGAESDAIASDADLRDSLWGTGFDGTSSTIVWRGDLELTDAGGAACLNMPAASAGAYSGLRLGWDGINAATKNTVKYVFYLQWLTYADSVYRDFHYGTNGVWGGKIAIIEAPDSSFDTGEVVIRRWSPPGGWVKGYVFGDVAGGVVEFGLDWSSPAEVASDFSFNNFYDAGSPTVTSVNTLQQRHGINFGDQNSTTGSDSDYATSPRLSSNGWVVHETYIDMTGKVIKHWMADYGSEPVLVLGAMTADLPDPGAMDGSGSLPAELYTGVQLTNYPNTATNWPGSDTFVCYDGVIASDDPISFPGGHSLPNSGTTTPAGYPPAGSSEL